MTRLLNGYIEISAKNVAEYCKNTIKHIENTQKFDDDEFLNWAIPYFGEIYTRKRWFEFWKPKEFNEYTFYDWFIKNYEVVDCLIGCCTHKVESKAFSEASRGFAGSNIRFCKWFPSDHGSVSLDVCARLLPIAKKLPLDEKIYLSIEDFQSITFGSKDKIESLKYDLLGLDNNK